MDNKRIEITLYRWAGRRFFFEIRSHCLECDLAVNVIRDLLEADFGSSPVPVTLRIKNWLDHAFESLWHGGWHAPVVLVNDRLFSQGVVPDRARLGARISELLREIHAVSESR